jgi:methylmalonyl-CoA mutase cobalamin-binding subunit
VSETLLMLVSPMDRHGDAARLRGAGFRVIVTSQVQSTARQVADAAPAAVVVEFVPAFASETFAFMSHLARASRRKPMVLFAYGSDASDTDRARLSEFGARWVPLGTSERGVLGVAVCNALLEPSAFNSA